MKFKKNLSELLKRSKKITVLLVPNHEGTPFSLKFSLLTFRVVVAAAAVGVFLFAFMSFSWLRLQHRASIAEQLIEENERLQNEYQRISAIEKRMAALNQLEDQVRKALGAQSNGTARELPPAVARAQQTATPEEKGVAEHPILDRSPDGSEQPNTYQFAEDLGVLKDSDIPSLWPVEGYVSRSYEGDPLIKIQAHAGVDVAAAEGTVVRATAGGVVVWCGWSALYGNVVILAHTAPYFSFYGHNQIILVQPQQRVERGAPIAFVGNSGKSSAAHLHFEIWYGNQQIDPQLLLIPS